MEDVANELPGIDPNVPGCYVIRSAEEAWALLRHAQSGGDLPDNLSLRFDGWPSFDMRVNGRDWHGTVPSRVMAPLLDVQRDLYRVYANVCYGDSNLRRLKDEERELLELVIKVNEGSSDYKAPLWEQMTELGKEAIKKMDSRDVVITVLGLAVVFGGVEITKAWLASRQQERQLEQSVELSKQETERLKIFSEAVHAKPVLTMAKEDFEATQNRLLKTVKPADTVVSAGVSLRGDEVAEIVQAERARSEDIDVSGVYRVQANDATKGAGFRIKIKRISDGLRLLAAVPLELDVEQKRLIQKAEWSKGAVLVHLSIRASILRGKITDAQVYSAAPVTDGHTL